MLQSVVILSNFRCGTHLLHEIFVANGYVKHDEILRTYSSIIPQDERDYFENHIMSYFKHDKFKYYSALKLSENMGYPSKHIKMLESKLARVWKPGSVAIVHKSQFNKVYGSLSSQETKDKLSDLFPKSIFILLERDPYEAAVSYFIARHEQRWSSTANKIGETPEFNEEELTLILNMYLDEWNWDNIQDLDAVHIAYNNLCDNPEMALVDFNIGIRTQKRLQKMDSEIKKEYVLKLKKLA